jgi:hypothetical protein
MTKPPPPFLPAAIDNPFLKPKPWTVLESTPIQAAVEFDSCTAMIPRNVNAYTDLIHWHELAHVKWTEGHTIFGKTEPGAWDHILREPQVNALLAKCLKIDVSPAMRAFDWSDHPVPLLPRECGMLWINLAYYLRDPANPSLHGFAGRLEAWIRASHDGDRAFELLLAAVEAVIKDPTPLTRQTWAVKLAEQFAPAPPPPPVEAELADETADAIEHAEQAEAEAEAAAKDELEREIQRQLGAGSAIDNMQIHEHITTHRPGRKLAAPGGARDTGIIPVLFDRYCTDRMIFRIRRGTGAVVIDCSGSMRWDWEQLRKGLRHFPNVVVGCYQGFKSDLRGRLCVIAKKGRWADYNPHLEPDLYGNNTVDYQALLWLASQPKPRVWLSDGMYCGGNAANNERNINDLMRKAGIIRIATLEATIAYLQGKQVPAFKEVFAGEHLARKR